MPLTRCYVIGHNDADNAYVCDWDDGWEDDELAAQGVAKQAMDRYLAELPDDEFAPEAIVIVEHPRDEGSFGLRVQAKLRAVVTEAEIIDLEDWVEDDEDEG